MARYSDWEACVARVISDVKANTGVRLDWPAWLDELVDACPQCGSEDIDFTDDREGGTLCYCRACDRSSWWPGPRPTKAEDLLITPNASRALGDLGHPLGGSGYPPSGGRGI